MANCYLGHDIPIGNDVCEEGHGPVGPNSTNDNGNVTIPAAMLQQLLNVVQSAQNGNNTTTPRHVEKPKRPTITAGLTLEKWNFLESRWVQYKNLAGLTSTNIAEHILECCDDDLRFDLHRSIGPTIITLTEDQVLSEIKKLAVTEDNTIVSRVILRGMSQGADEEIKHFAARVKGQADICKYFVTCTRPNCDTKVSYADSEIKDQICKGLYDSEIQQDVLALNNDTMTLKDTIKFISAKESAKRSHTALHNPTGLNKISQ